MRQLTRILLVCALALFGANAIAKETPLLNITPERTTDLDKAIQQDIKALSERGKKVSEAALRLITKGRFYIRGSALCAAA